MPCEEEEDLVGGFDAAAQERGEKPGVLIPRALLNPLEFLFSSLVPYQISHFINFSWFFNCRALINGQDLFLQI